MLPEHQLATLTSVLAEADLARQLAAAPEAGRHSWSAVVLCDLTEDEAERFAGLDLDGRAQFIAARLGAKDDIVRARVVRGPLCSECRVDRAEVDRLAAIGTPWPCPGKRPKALGGPLEPDPGRRTRQQVRDDRRRAVKQVTIRERETREAVARAQRSRREKAPAK